MRDKSEESINRRPVLVLAIGTKGTNHVRHFHEMLIKCSGHVPSYIQILSVDTTAQSGNSAICLPSEMFLCIEDARVAEILRRPSDFDDYSSASDFGPVAVACWLFVRA